MIGIPKRIPITRRFDWVFLESYRHKKARNVNCGLFRYCHQIYLGSPVTYLVELGGFEPPSEITTPSALHA